jgi:amino acid transporter
MGELKRALNLWQAITFGMGVILGAGIYVVIGRTAALAGPSIWLSVVVAGSVAFFTGLSYAELAGMYPKASSSYYYIRKAIPRRETLAFVVGWMIFFEAASGASTAAVGFTKYFLELFQFPSWLPQNLSFILVAITVIIIFSIVNYIGISESSKLNTIFTLIGVSGLILVIIMGFLFGRELPAYFDPPPMGLMGVFNGAALIFFAYVGFELMATTSEETIDAKRTMPKAIIIALAICGSLYILISFAVVKLVPWQRLAVAGAPLADAVGAVLGSSGWYVLATVALFATSNAVLGFLVSSSRIAYGMASDGIIHRKLASIHGVRKTPHNAIILAGMVAVFEIVISSFIGGDFALDIVAKASNLGCLIAFIFINSAVVLLRKSEVERPFKIPFTILGVPVFPILGALLSVAMIAVAFHEIIVWAITLVILVLGFVVKKQIIKTR